MSAHGSDAPHGLQAPWTRKKLWSCKIGEAAVVKVPNGGDLPMREAVAAAYKSLTGVEPDFIFSGWGDELTEPERAVVQNRLPSEAYEKEWHERNASERSEIATPQGKTPRTEFVRALTDHAAANELSVNPALQTACSLLCDAAINIEALERELSSANERLNAPVPEVEGQIVQIERVYHGNKKFLEFVPADLARDLGRRLATAQLSLCAADAMAEAVDTMIQRRALDSRSLVADARLDYGDPFKYEAKEASQLAEAVAKDQRIYDIAYRTGRSDECAGIEYAENVLEKRMLNDIAAIRGSSEGGGNG